MADEETFNEPNNVPAAPAPAEDTLNIPENLQGYVHGLREEAKRYRVELKGFKDNEKTAQAARQAEMTEQEKLSARIKAAETDVNSAKTEAQNLKIENSILKNAAKHNFVDLDTVIVLTREALAGEQEITVDVIEKALAKIAKEKSFLVKTDGATIVPNPANRLRPELSAAKTGDEQLLGMLKGR